MIDLSRLNPMQRKAVAYGDGPLLVLAGAGSGKTRMLTYRIARLIEEGVPAGSILAITFTNKAAREMRERVTALCGEAAEDAWISTFHSCCVRMLRRDIEKLGYKRSFTIYDESDSLTVIRRLQQEIGLNDKEVPARLIKSIISDRKNKLIGVNEWLRAQRPEKRNDQIADLMTRYDEELRSNNALDFDDLLVKTLELLSDNPPVRQAYIRKFSNILVDEYQDTNQAQYQLIRLLVNEKHNICVVGDDDQSIYGWRGADIRNILEFEKDFKGCRTVKLEQNYRSDGNILEAANHIIRNNTGRKEKSLWTEAGAGEPVHVYTALDERDEASWICMQANALRRQDYTYGDMAVLYRTNAQSRVIEEALVRSGIPYSVYGGMRFYDRKEIKDLVAYLRILMNPEDDVSVLRIINEPKRGIGEGTIRKISEHAAQEGISFFSAILDYENIDVSRQYKLALGSFASQLTELFELRFELSVTELTDKVIDITRYAEQYRKEKTDENETRLENIDEFRGSVEQFEQTNPEGGLEGFLENVALVTDMDSMQGARTGMTLMTLHAAKGLEFPVVFMAGMEEGIFPSSRSTMDEPRMEEERRLCYVGVTRAMKKLYLLNARSRTLFGSRNMNERSRFIDEIPRRLLDDSRLAGSRSFEQRFAGGGQVSVPKIAHRSTQEMPGALGIPGLRKGFGLQTQEVVSSPARDLPRRTELFSVGDRVLHRQFREGTVTELRESNGSRRVVINFDSCGEKVFPADTALVVKINK